MKEIPEVHSAAADFGSLWQMTRQARIVTFIGAGGKTTCLNRLTWEIAQAGQAVITTTTTKVYPLLFPSQCPTAGVFPFPDKGQPVFWHAGIEEASGKWLGIPTTRVDEAIQAPFDPVDPCHWVIEGDGARGRSLKCWAAHEPQIPRLTETAVLVIDGRLWGQLLQADMIHRPERCRSLIGQVWDSERAWEYLRSSPVFQAEYRLMDWVVFFNERCAPESEARSKRIDNALCELVQRGLAFYRPMISMERLPQEVQLPMHLRLAAGNAKEGNLHWYDLW